jgi:hypothetical protein
MPNGRNEGRLFPARPLEEKITTIIADELRSVDVFASDTPNLNAWPQPNVIGEFSTWLAKRIADRLVRGAC